MRLSEKGLSRLAKETKHVFIDGTCRVYPIRQAQVEAMKTFKFEPDDFQGMVCLTVEEAKEIYDDLIRLSEMSSLDISRYYAWKRLNERIEQAEMSKQSTSEG